MRNIRLCQDEHNAASRCRGTFMLVGRFMRVQAIQRRVNKEAANHGEEQLRREGTNADEPQGWPRTEQPAPVVIPGSELLRWVTSETPRGRCGDWLSRVADPVVPLPSIQTRDPRTCSAARKPCSNLTQYSRRGVEILPYLTELSYKGRHVTRGPSRHRWDPRGKSTDGALKCVAREEMP
jgi:hypothetical protein